MASGAKSLDKPKAAGYIRVTPASVGLSGRPIQVVKVSDEHAFELVEDNLTSLLHREDVRDKPVVVVSVAGAFRKGKSFLLNFFIRYLSYIGQSEDYNDYGWLDNEEAPLGGFAWRGGAERETTGILMWNEPFIVKTPDGDDVVVILLDTQGAFDTESTVKECATIFALSTMLSSVQVYNLHSNIQENDLQHLQLFTEYGKLATISGENTKPFQSLLFLVRDWSYPYDYEYGMDGGNQLLSKRLQLSPSQHEELQLLRQQIRSCFETIDCFLMPHPGLKVATNPRFDGRLREVDGEFKEYLRELVPQLLSRESLIVKEISGNQVTGQDLVEYFRVYMRIFQGDTLPEPKSLMHATAEANNLVALTAAKNLYNQRMDATCGGDRPYLNPDQLMEAHENFKRMAIEAFHAVKKMGGTEFSASYVEALENDIMGSWESYASANDSKSMLRSLRTPITLFSCFVIFYMTSGLFAAVGLTGFVSLINAFILISLVMLATWGYCRHSGELREVGSKIDEIAQIIWDLAFFTRQVHAWYQDNGVPRPSSALTHHQILAGPIQRLTDQGMSHVSNMALGNATSAQGVQVTQQSSVASGLNQRRITRQSVQVTQQSSVASDLNQRRIASQGTESRRRVTTASTINTN